MVKVRFWSVLLNKEVIKECSLEHAFEIAKRNHGIIIA